MANTLILLDQVTNLVNASLVVAVGETKALPSRAVVIGVQFTVDVAAGNFTVLLQVSLDGTNWFTIKSMTQADLVGTGYFTSLAGPYAAKFIRGNVTVNSVPHAVTLDILCKAAQ